MSSGTSSISHTSVAAPTDPYAAAMAAALEGLGPVVNPQDAVAQALHQAAARAQSAAAREFDENT